MTEGQMWHDLGLQPLKVVICLSILCVVLGIITMAEVNSTEDSVNRQPQATATQPALPAEKP